MPEQVREQDKKRNDKPSRPTLDHETFVKLVEEGRQIRRAFESAAACTRVITAHDMKFRSR